MSTKRFTIFLVAVMFLVTLLTPFGFSAQASPLLQAQAGDMNLDGYCKYLGYIGIRLDPTQQNVNGWGCLRSDGTQAGMDLYDLCKWQYGGAMPYPEYSDYNNAYSWFCSSEDLGSPAQRPQSVQPQSNPDGSCLGFNRGVSGEDLSLYFEPDGNLWLRENPSFSAQKIRKVSPDTKLISYGEMTCAEGYTWMFFHYEDDVGWIMVYNGDQKPTIPQTQKPSATSTPKPQPTLKPDFSQPAQTDSGTLKPNPTLLPEAVHICDPDCNEEDGNWVTFFLPANKFEAASERLHSSSFLGSVLAVFSTPSPCREDKNPTAPDGFICEEMGLSHRLVNFFVTFKLVSLDLLRDPNNWSLTYTSN